MVCNTNESFNLRTFDIKKTLREKLSVKPYSVDYLLRGVILSFVMLA